MVSSDIASEPAPQPAVRRANYGVKDAIRDYWSHRATTFDRSAGHRIRSEAELRAWADLLRRQAPDLPGARVLELACGTGEFTRVLLSLGCRIEALDFAEPMLARAEAKLGGAPGLRLSFGDAEDTMLADASVDAVVCRHLVWTLVDPRRAFADWRRVLRPGGVLLVVDGDWVRETRLARALRRWGALWDRAIGAPALWDQAAHERIMAEVFFREGLRPQQLAAMLVEAGFEAPVSGALDPVRRPQLAAATWRERLTLLGAYRGGFVLTARKPA